MILEPARHRATIRQTGHRRQTYRQKATGGTYVFETPVSKCTCSESTTYERILLVSGQAVSDSEFQESDENR